MCGTGITFGADLVGTIENKYIRDDTNTKLCPEMQMDRLQHHKTFIEYGNEVKLENKIKYTRQMFEKLI